VDLPSSADGCRTLGLMIGTLSALNDARARRDLGELGPDGST
jgi:hypothetical protein